MDKRRKKVVTALLVGSLILVVQLYRLRSYLPSATSADMVAPAGMGVSPAIVSTASAASAVDPSLEKIWEAQERVANKAWGRDPFESPLPVSRVETKVSPEPTSAPAPSPPKLAFSGVSRSGGQWLAAVDGNIVRVGDEIVGGFRVTRITTHALTITLGEWDVVYSLGSEQPVVRPRTEEP